MKDETSNSLFIYDTYISECNYHVFITFMYYIITVFISVSFIMFIMIYKGN
jgi:hypothetical protein